MGTFYHISGSDIGPKSSSAKIYLSKGGSLFIDGERVSKTIKVFFITKDKLNSVISSIDKGTNNSEKAVFKNNNFARSSFVATASVSHTTTLDLARQAIELFQSDVSEDVYASFCNTARVLFAISDNNSKGHLLLYDGPMSEIKRAEDFRIKEHTGSFFTTYNIVSKKTEGTTSDPFKCRDAKHQNGFFKSAGLYRNGKQWTKTGAYGVLKDNGTRWLYPNGKSTFSKDKALSWGNSNDTSKYQLIELKSRGKVGYINVNWSGVGGSDSSDSDGSGGSGVSVGEDTSYDMDSVDFPTSRYAGAENLVKSYLPENATLYFVGCKDTRTTKTIDDPLGANYPQNKFVGSNIDSANSRIKKSEDTSTCLLLQPYVHRAMATTLGNVAEGVWHTDVRSGTQVSTSTDLIQDLDTVLDIDYKKSTANWKSSLPPLYIENVNKHSNAYITHRMLPYSALIIKDSYNPDGKSFKTIKKDGNAISFYDYFNLSASERAEYKIVYFSITVETKKSGSSYTHSFTTTLLSDDEKPTFQAFVDSIMQIKRNIELNGYEYEIVVSSEPGHINLYSLELFLAYTRGHDFIQEKYTTVRPDEQTKDGIRKMSFDDNYFTYKYTGRDIDIFQGQDEVFTVDDTPCALIHEKDLLLSSDVTLGETYGEQKYFIQAIKYPKLNNGEKTGDYLWKDTFKVDNYLEAVGNTEYVKDDLKIKTNTIDLSKCEFYDPTAATYENHWCDCCYNGGEKGEFKQECYYQKTGKCPYRFQTEKHPRRIRTLKQSKSNRFNLIQELCKTFEFYPYFYIEYEKNGKVKTDENGQPKKHVFFMTEKGTEKYSGFRYEKNLSSISRNLDSDALTTRLIVESVDSQISDTGLCSIALATDNLSKENSIYNFSYYVQKGLLDAEQVQRDLYGIEKDDLAYLTRVGNYNSQYDNYSNLIITMTGDMLVKLQAQIEVKTTGVATSLEERQKKSQQMYQFKQQAEKTANRVNSTKVKADDYLTSDTYLSYLQSYRNLTTALFSDIEALFFSNNNFTYTYLDEKDEVVSELHNYTDEKTITCGGIELNLETLRKKYCNGEFFFRLEIEGFDEYPDYSPPFDTWEEFEDKIVKEHLYKVNGELGQYNSLYNQVRYWKLQRQKILNKINSLYEEFYQKYEPFIKEGTWTDSNYLSHNSYYWSGVDVLNDSCKPKVSYTINVIDISPLEEYADDYTFELADTTYLEDIDFFDINKRTGLPNRQKVMISGIEYHLDEQSQNSITVQNYSSQFDDLFGAITASVQSLTFNENMYKRAANFTPHQYVQAEALQGTLDEGDLTLIDANDENVVIDDDGAKGKNINNPSSQYDLNGQGLFFSNDGGNTWDIGVGPQGINMDYAKFGSLDASKVQIVDGNYIYFLWDKNGINAYRDPSASTTGLVDFARFNKYGLSLIENNNVRLRAGYAFKSTANSGDYSTEADLTNQNVGFYLYNDKGQAIFKTETASSYSKASNSSDYTARLSLDGEMFVTNTILEDEKESYSVLSATLGNQLSNGMALTTDSVDYPISDSIFNNINIPSHFYICYNGEALDNIYSGDELVRDVNRIDEYIRVQGYPTNVAFSNYIMNDRNISKAPTSGQMKLYKFTKKTYAVENSSTPTLISDLINDATQEVDSSISFKYYNQKEYQTDSVNVLLRQNTSAYANLSGTAQTQSITYYDVSDTTTTSYSPITETLYKYDYVYDGEDFNYWHGFGEGASVITNSTDNSIDQIGIWINNKIPSNKTGSSANISGVVETEDEETEETTTTTVTEETVDETIISKVCDLNTMYFVGDSVTEGWNLKASTLGSPELESFANRMFGYGGKGFMSTSWITENMYLPSTTTHAAFNFGINGFTSSSQVNPTTIKTNYTALIEKFLTNCSSIQQIYVVSPIYAPETSRIGNTKVGEYLDDVREALMSIDWGQIHGAEVITVDIWEATKDGANVNDVHSNNATKCVPAVYNAINSAGGTSGASDSTISNNVNKDAEAAVAQLNKGAERIFLIGAKTDKAYRNILSVLKNGSLFIGGEIRDEMGNTIETQFEYMPDKIKVINPQITMSIDGYMWCDWSKFFNIGYDDNGNLLYQVNNSLLDYLNAATGGGGSEQKDDGLTGYYFLDPMG